MSGQQRPGKGSRAYRHAEQQARRILDGTGLRWSDRHLKRTTHLVLDLEAQVDPGKVHALEESLIASLAAGQAKP